CSAEFVDRSPGPAVRAPPVIHHRGSAICAKCGGTIVIDPGETHCESASVKDRSAKGGCRAPGEGGRGYTIDDGSRAVVIDRTAGAASAGCRTPGEGGGGDGSDGACVID